MNFYARKSGRKKKAKSPLAKKKEYLRGIWGEAVRLLYDGICAVCGKGGSNPHHFYGKKAYPSVMFDTDNGVWMCFYCHIRKTHQKGDTEPARKALIERIGEDEFTALGARANETGKRHTLTSLEALEIKLLALINQLRQGQCRNP